MSNEKQQIIGIRVLAALSYIWVLWVIPFIIGTSKGFIKDHAKQGAVLFACEVIATILMAIPPLGIIVWIFCVVVGVIGIIRAAHGQSWQIPWVGKFVKNL